MGLFCPRSSGASIKCRNWAVFNTELRNNNVLASRVRQGHRQCLTMPNLWTQKKTTISEKSLIFFGFRDLTTLAFNVAAEHSARAKPLVGAALAWIWSWSQLFPCCYSSLREKKQWIICELNAERLARATCSPKPPTEPANPSPVVQSKLLWGLTGPRTGMGAPSRPDPALEECEKIGYLKTIAILNFMDHNRNFFTAVA